MLLFFLFSILFLCVRSQQALFDVPSALFVDGLWKVNVNYLDANSTKMYNQYKMEAVCDTLVQFQEIFCLGKSLSVSIQDDDDPSALQTLMLNSTSPYNCSMNVQDPNQAILIANYTQGNVTLPAGNYTISMNLVNGNTSEILGFRGFAIRASTPVERIILASKCRTNFHQNGPLLLH